MSDSDGERAADRANVAAQLGNGADALAASVGPLRDIAAGAPPELVADVAERGEVTARLDALAGQDGHATEKVELTDRLGPSWPACPTARSRPRSGASSPASRKPRSRSQGALAALSRSVTP